MPLNRTTAPPRTAPWVGANNRPHQNHFQPTIIEGKNRAALPSDLLGNGLITPGRSVDRWWAQLKMHRARLPQGDMADRSCFPALR